MNDKRIDGKKDNSLEWLGQAKMASWWVTWDDLAWPCDTLEAQWQRRAETFARSGVNAVVMFGLHFRWDYVTVLDRVFGLLGRIAEICHEHGLRVVEHHSAAFVHRARTEKDRWAIRRNNSHHVPFYPDGWDGLTFEGSSMAHWRQISARDGQPVYVENYNAEVFCPNHPEVQQAYQRLVERHLERVRIDALMSDDVMFPPDRYSCACEHCRARFREKTGLELPPPENQAFWEDASNEALQAWLDFRYTSTADHYRRVRAFLPEDVALWGCASGCVPILLRELGFAPQRFVPHCDAVFHEIWERFDATRDHEQIVTELAVFASLARRLDKPLLTIFYAKKPEDVTPWLEVLRSFGSRPWLSKMPRNPKATPEEILLGDSYLAWNENDVTQASPRNTIRFSHRHRDQLTTNQAEEYIQAYRRCCNKLLREGPVDVLLDGQERVAALSHKAVVDPARAKP